MKHTFLILSLTALLCISCSRKTQASNTDGESAIAMSVSESDSAAAPLQAIAEADKPTVLEFSATWCGPCRRQAPIFHAVQEKYGDRLNMLSIDVDQYPELAQKYQISAVPTFVFLDKQGKVIGSANFLEQNELEDIVKHLLAR